MFTEDDRKNMPASCFILWDIGAGDFGQHFSHDLTRQETVTHRLSEKERLWKQVIWDSHL